MGDCARAADVFLEEIAEITAITRGVALRGRCFAIGTGTRRRMEIVLESGGERAVVDVPPGHDVRKLLTAAADVFSQSLAARR